MARFFVRKENIHEADATIAGQEFEHLRRVLRLTVGDRVTLFDDTGWEYEAVIRSLHADRGELAISRSYQAGRDSPLALTLALGLTKGEKMDFVVEKATELGVASILPFTSSFTVPKLDAQENRQSHRALAENRAERGETMWTEPGAGDFAAVRVSSYGRRRRRKPAQVVFLGKGDGAIAAPNS